MPRVAQLLLKRALLLPFRGCRWVCAAEDRVRRRIGLMKTDSPLAKLVPLPERLWAMRHGFYADRVLFYGLDKKNFRRYMPDWVHDRLHPVNGRFSGLIDDKLQLPLLLKDFPEHAPAYLCLIYESEIIDLSGKDSNTGPYHPEELLSLLKTHNKLIIKPLSGEGGAGVLRIQEDAGTLSLNGSPCAKEEVLERLAGLEGYIVSEFVVQHDYAIDLYPSTTNTVRLITMHDYDEHRAFIGAAFHRVGTARSVPVDNLKQGGILCSIEVESGTIGPGLTWRPESGVEQVERHPDTGAPLSGKVIPSWDWVCTKVLRMADRFAFLPYMGWDIVVTREGFKVLEINSLPTLLWQIHVPICQNPRAQEFFSRISRRRGIGHSSWR